MPKASSHPPPVSRLLTLCRRKRMYRKNHTAVRVRVYIQQGCELKTESRYFILFHFIFPDRKPKKKIGLFATKNERNRPTFSGFHRKTDRGAIFVVGSQPWRVVRSIILRTIYIIFSAAVPAGVVTFNFNLSMTATVRAEQWLRYLEAYRRTPTTDGHAYTRSGIVKCSKKKKNCLCWRFNIWVWTWNWLWNVFSLSYVTWGFYSKRRFIVESARTSYWNDVLGNVVACLLLTLASLTLTHAKLPFPIETLSLFT